MDDITIGYNEEDVRTKNVVCGVLAIVLPWFAIHKFILGYTRTAIIQLILSFVTFGLFSIVSFVEGIIYLTKSERVFYDTYIANEKKWF